MWMGNSSSKIQRSGSIHLNRNSNLKIGIEMNKAIQGNELDSPNIELTMLIW